MKKKKYWFKPKKYGYGATPTTIEGWIIILIYILIVVLDVIFFIKNQLIFFGILFISIISLILISKYKTKDEWRWRWG